MLNEKRVANYLRKHVGENVSSWQLVSRAKALNGRMNDLSVEECFRMNAEVFRIAEENGFFLDMSEHEFKLEGMPWNLDFVIRKKEDQ